MIKQMQEFMRMSGINQRQMAERLKISESQLNRWLKGRCKISKLWCKEIKSIISSNDG